MELTSHIKGLNRHTIYIFQAIEAINLLFAQAIALYEEKLPAVLHYGRTQHTDHPRSSVPGCVHRA